MNANDCDLPATSSNKRRFSQYYQQLGAPTLIYEGNRRDDSHFRVASTSLTTDNARDVYETCKSRNRVKARWQYSIDVDQLESVTVPDFAYGKRKYRAAKYTKHKNTKKDSNKDEVDDNGSDDYDDRSRTSKIWKDDDNNEENQEIGNKRWIDEKQQRNRLAMLLENDTRMSRHKECLQNYALYEHPYVDIELKSRHHRKSKYHAHRRSLIMEEPKVEPATYSKGQEFSINHKINSRD